MSISAAFVSDYITIHGLGRFHELLKEALIKAGKSQANKRR